MSHDTAESTAENYRSESNTYATCLRSRVSFSSKVSNQGPGSSEHESASRSLRRKREQRKQSQHQRTSFRGAFCAH